MAEARYPNDFLGTTFEVRRPVESTGGYLAQPLAGFWARAPYFHNGSVPTLAGVLNGVGAVQG